MKFSRLVFIGVGLTLLSLQLAACSKNRSDAERLQSAYESFQIGENRSAMIELKNLLLKNPSHKDARLLLARASLKLGDPESAEKELDRATELGAAADETYVLKLQSMLMQGKHEEVASSYDASVLTITENQEIAKVFYANAQLGDGNEQVARSLFEEVLENGTSNESRRMALLGLADVSRASQDSDKALEYCEQALVLDPESSESIVALGQVHLGLKNYAAAHEAFTKIRSNKLAGTNERFLAASGEVDSALGMDDMEAALSAARRLSLLAPDNPISLYLRARVANANDDKEDAYNLLQKVLSRYPSFRPAQLMQGALSLERQEYEQAKMFLGSVVAAQPGNQDARKLLAETLIQMNKPGEAAELLGDAMAAGTADKQMLGMLGRANLQLDDKQNSIDQIKRALESNPGNSDLQLALAASYVSAGRTKDAIALFDKMEATDGSDRRRDLLLLLAAMQEKDRDGLRQQADRIRRLWPDDAKALHLIGGAFYSLGEFKKAREIFEHVTKIAPDDINAITNLGRIDLAQGHVSAAIERYRNFLDAHPDSQMGHVALAFIYQSAGELDNARRSIETAYQLDPKNEATANVYARYLLSEKKFGAATDVVNAIIEANPKSLAAYHTRAGVLEAQQRYKEALESLVIAESLRPDNISILRDKARNEIRLQLYSQARSTFEKIRKLDSSDMIAARSLALLELQSKSPERAQAVLDSLLAEFPNDKNTYAIIGDVRRHAKDTDAAIEAYRKSYQIEPTRKVMLSLYGLAADQNEAVNYLRGWLSRASEDIGVRLLLAQRLQAMDESQEAIEHYEKVIALAPDSALAVNNLAWLYFEKSGDANLHKARTLAKQAYELQPKSAPIVDTYGWILFRTGDVVGGKAMLATAEELAKASGTAAENDIVYHYAVALSESGEKTQARNRLQKIVSGDAQFASRKEAEQLLESLKR